MHEFDYTKKSNQTRENKQWHREVIHYEHEKKKQFLKADSNSTNVSGKETKNLQSAAKKQLGRKIHLQPFCVIKVEQNPHEPGHFNTRA